MSVLDALLKFGIQAGWRGLDPETPEDLTEEMLAERLVHDGELPAIEEIRAAMKPDYRKLRVAEYPPIGDQLDAIMKWLATENEFAIPAELKSIAMKCMSVKAKYPKPEGGGDA